MMFRKIFSSLQGIENDGLHCDSGDIVQEQFKRSALSKNFMIKIQIYRLSQTGEIRGEVGEK